MSFRIAAPLAQLLLVAVLLAPTLESQTLGVPVLYRGSVVGCAERFGDLAEAALVFGKGAVYFLGIRDCPECAEMERYLRSFLPGGELIYVDVVQHGEFFKKLVGFLGRYVEDRYLAEVPVVIVTRNSQVVVVSIGAYRNDTYWKRVLLENYVELCYVRTIEPGSYGAIGLVAGAAVLGIASALSPCILYLYTALLLSYSTSSVGNPVPKLLSFVLGLGLGYSLILAGLRGVLWFLKPFSWVLFIAFGLYMILHSRGALGCLIGGRSCRDFNYAPSRSAALTAVLGKFFPLLMGFAASFSAVPCGAGYFIVLQVATEGSEPLLSFLTLIYVASFTAPYLLFSLLSSRLLKLVERFLSKVTVVELAGGLALVAIGIYVAITT
ncbi:MAG: cytochrome c biogenesis protein CcdA [Sulfolobales archaeon]|nr:hypothetical protein [Sulfolobales archaeon]MCX8208468.1 hypothetical protein [Sulfolobales archaeon]MDW8010224.1 cytochrome c biogenesis protein CcdA [Sulfolobales archaeon]